MTREERAGLCGWDLWDRNGLCQEQFAPWVLGFAETGGREHWESSRIWGPKLGAAVLSSLHTRLFDLSISLWALVSSFGRLQTSGLAYLQELLWKAAQHCEWPHVVNCNHHAGIIAQTAASLTSLRLCSSWFDTWTGFILGPQVERIGQGKGRVSFLIIFCFSCFY